MKRPEAAKNGLHRPKARESASGQQCLLPNPFLRSGMIKPPPRSLVRAALKYSETSAFDIWGTAPPPRGRERRVKGWEIDGLRGESAGARRVDAAGTERTPLAAPVREVRPGPGVADPVEGQPAAAQPSGTCGHRTDLLPALKVRCALRRESDSLAPGRESETREQVFLNTYERTIWSL